MTGNEYQELAGRTLDGKSTKRLYDAICDNVRPGIVDIDLSIGELLMGCLGLTGEAGEFCDLIKKFLYHETPLDEQHAKKELGDICWYIACICDAFGWDLDEVMSMNIDKLKKRYPDGFDVERANNRAEGDV